MMNSVGLVLLLATVCLCAASVEPLDGGTETAAGHFEPMVAMLCPTKGEPYYNKYLLETGDWETDLDPPATCPQDKVAVLRYCKKVYPERDITNIVEGNQYMKLGGWCPTASSPQCTNTQEEWVKPFRCLEGPFQSDALLVPDQCRFDHIHNQTNCWTFEQWNSTATASCANRQMIIRSFAILLPCGIDLFSGVEFVCCPTSVKQLIEAGYGQNIQDNDQDDDYYADEEDTYYNDEYTQAEEKTPQSTSAAPTTARTTQDPYLTHYMPKSEHADFIQAEARFDERHKERVAKLMKEWTKGQALHSQDSKNSEEVKQDLASRYQHSLKELEEEHQAQRRQLVAMHQQRVISRFNEKKKESLACYTDALKASPQNIHRVKRCLQRVLRALHKERQHSILQFHRLLDSSIEAARSQLEAVLHQLQDIDASIKQNLEKLQMYPDLREKVAPLMNDYLGALRTRDGTPSTSLIMDIDSERALLLSLIQEREEAILKEREVKSGGGEKGRVERKYEGLDKNGDEIRSIEQEEHTGHIKVEVHATALHNENQREIQQQKLKQQHPFRQQKPSVHWGGGEPLPIPDAFLEKSSAEDLPVDSHAQTHQISHSSSYTLRHTHESEHNSLYVLSMLGAGMMVVVVIGLVLRRRASDEISHDGFIQVETSSSPEEQLVSTMQMTGYENPTYKYFETST